MTGAVRYLSARELADLQLPDLPQTERAWRARGTAENWPSIARPGRGGGRLYLVDDLPADIRATVLSALGAKLRRVQPAKASNDFNRRRGRPKGTDFFTTHPDVAEAVTAYLSHQRLAATRIMEMLATEFVDLPSPRSLRRFIAGIEAARPALLAAVRDPDHFNSRYRISLGRADGGVTHAHQIWEIDTTPADVLTKGGRKQILGLIDRWSRRARFMVVDSESAQNVRRFLIDTIDAWGAVPEQLITDNGSGYRNQTIMSALDMLGIDHKLCLPGDPMRKPFIERLFGTFTRQRAELLAGYAGHSVAEAQKLRAKAKKQTGRALIVPEMDPDELQAVIDNWRDATYDLAVHSGTRVSPLERMLSSAKAARAAPPRDVLERIFTAYVGALTVGKRGLQWKHGRYWSSDLVPYMGRIVHVRRDEADLGELVVFDENGEFICTAINYERAGLSEQEFALAARRDQDRIMVAHRRELADARRRFSPEKARDRILRDEAERAGKLVSMPRPSREHDTPAIRSMRTEAIQPPVISDRDRERIARVQARPKPEAGSFAAMSSAEKIEWTDRIIAASQRGEAVDPADLRQAQNFTISSDYRAQKMIAGHFGKTTLNDRPSAKGQVA